MRGPAVTKGELQTERLRLIPLDATNLRLSIEDPVQLEASLCLEPRGSLPPEQVVEATRQMLDGVLGDADNWLFHTNWSIVLTAQSRIIGGLCFKGPPDEHRCVEIGYGLDPPFQGHGYMTEELGETVRWALNQADVLAVVCETDRGNVASHGVLRRVGFAPCHETAEQIGWRISRD
jgi:ribosomal-protein-alanine N-acetyltransferase